MKIQAKKSLGQNFLIDKNVIDLISNLEEIKDKSILEVGPGTGNLTSNLIKKKPKKIFVIEKDNKLAILLKKNFNKEISIINEDILKIDEKKLCKDKLIVFGNLPYNISTEILIKWIMNMHYKKSWFDYLILMFQKEVADRIISKFNNKTYGRLSIIANWRLNIKKICDIGPHCFSPKPKVESSLLLLKPKENFINFESPKNLEKITRIFFMHRRKKIKTPFLQLFDKDKYLATKLGIDLNLRPQNLDFNTYFELTKEYENLRC